jgi:5-methylcytosine-specific restriction protein B
MTPTQIEQQTTLFRDRFGPAVLRGLDGEALLRLMHGRESSESRCLAYWLEFKNDDEFTGNRFGGIGGGSALKFGIFQRQSDGAWMTGSPLAQQALSLEDAIAIARTQRDELLAGAEVLISLDAGDTSDTSYAQLQTAMEKAAPKLSGDVSDANCQSGGDRCLEQIATMLLPSIPGEFDRGGGRFAGTI